MQSIRNGVEVITHLEVGVIADVECAPPPSTAERNPSCLREVVCMNVIGVDIFFGYQRWLTLLEPLNRQTILSINAWRTKKCELCASATAEVTQCLLSCDAASRSRIGRSQWVGLVNFCALTVAVHTCRTDVGPARQWLMADSAPRCALTV